MYVWRRYIPRPTAVESLELRHEEKHRHERPDVDHDHSNRETWPISTSLVRFTRSINDHVLPVRFTRSFVLMGVSRLGARRTIEIIEIGDCEFIQIVDRCLLLFSLPVGVPRSVVHYSTMAGGNSKNRSTKTSGSEKSSIWKWFSRAVILSILFVVCSWLDTIKVRHT